MRLREINYSYSDDQTFRSSSGVFFRRYNVGDHYFKSDTVSLYGKKLPFRKVIGIPKDDENSNFYTYYTYPRLPGSHIP